MSLHVAHTFHKTNFILKILILFTDWSIFMTFSVHFQDVKNVDSSAKNQMWKSLPMKRVRIQPNATKKHPSPRGSEWHSHWVPCQYTVYTWLRRIKLCWWYHYRHRKPNQQYIDFLHAHLYFQRFFWKLNLFLMNWLFWR